MKFSFPYLHGIIVLVFNPARFIRFLNAQALIENNFHDM